MVGVLISEEEYNEYLKLKENKETRTVDDVLRFLMDNTKPEIVHDARTLSSYVRGVYNYRDSRDICITYNYRVVDKK